MLHIFSGSFRVLHFDCPGIRTRQEQIWFNETLDVFASPEGDRSSALKLESGASQGCLPCFRSPSLYLQRLWCWGLAFPNNFGRSDSRWVKDSNACRGYFAGAAWLVDWKPWNRATVAAIIIAIMVIIIITIIITITIIMIVFCWLTLFVKFH